MVGAWAHLAFAHVDVVLCRNHLSGLVVPKGVERRHVCIDEPQVGELQGFVAAGKDVVVGEIVREVAPDAHEPGIAGHIGALLQHPYLLDHLVYLALLCGDEAVLVPFPCAELRKHDLLPPVSFEISKQPRVAFFRIEVFVDVPVHRTCPIHIGVQGDAVHSRVSPAIPFLIFLDEGAKPLVEPPDLPIAQGLVAEIHGGRDKHQAVVLSYLLHLRPVQCRHRRNHVRAPIAGSEVRLVVTQKDLRGGMTVEVIAQLLFFEALVPAHRSEKDIVLCTRIEPIGAGCSSPVVCPANAHFKRIGPRSGIMGIVLAQPSLCAAPRLCHNGERKHQHKHHPKPQFTSFTLPFHIIKPITEAKIIIS